MASEPEAVEGASGPRPSWVLAGLGAVGLLVASVGSPSEARSAAAQDWPPFVLVAGLLVVGLVADDDGLFEFAGHQLARLAKSATLLFAGAVVLIGVVTAVLNLDTGVAFLTPILVYTARRRGESEVLLLVSCILLANAGSLFLPGSNLTNLIVLGHLHLTGGGFLAHMWAPALVAVAVTAAVVAVLQRGLLRLSAEDVSRPQRPVLGVGLLAVMAVAVLVVVLRSPALPVAIVAALAALARLVRGKVKPQQVAGSLGLPMLVGLFGIAVALGTLGRAWSGPATMLSHLGLWSTAAVAAAVSVLFNNLPAASALAARVPPHPFALLVGLNLGPNLFVTGSLAWLLWMRAARTAGAHPPVATASRIGLIAVPISLSAAILVLRFAG